MHKFTAIALAAMATVAFAAPAAATVVNLNAATNASTDGSHAVTQTLGAGTYEVTFIEGDYTAFSRWSTIAGCNDDGESCRQGWENSAIFYWGPDLSGAYFLGDNNAHGGYGPFPPAYFSTADESFAHSGTYSLQFTLSAATDVSFFIGDTNVSDNRGGVSLSVMQVAVPEPAPWPLLLTGLGIMGALFHLRQRKASLPSH